MRNIFDRNLFANQTKKGSTNILLKYILNKFLKVVYKI